MKIGICYDFLKELGGLERVVFSQSNALAVMHTVKLLFGYVSSNSNIESCYGNMDIKKIDNTTVLNSEFNDLLKLFFCKPLEGYDLLISHSFMTYKLAHKTKKKTGTPYIVYIHHPPNFLYDTKLNWVNNFSRFVAFTAGVFFRPILKYIDKRHVSNADMVIVNSEYTANRVKKIYNRDSIVIYPPVAEFFLDNKIYDLPEPFNSCKYFLLHGRIIKDKRPDYCIEAFARLSSNSDMKLIISGSIEEKNTLEKLVEKHNIEEKVVMLGRVTEQLLKALYTNAVAMIMPAPKEDFGMTISEALSCGCPVVAWKDKSGPEEIVDDGINGFLATPYDLDDLAKKMDAANKKDWDRDSIRSSVHKYSESLMQKKLLKLTNKILDDNRRIK